MSLSSEYSFIDRCLHHVAFCHPLVQKVLGEIETDFYRKNLATVTTGSEVFVTGLPRSGTTLLLELLYGTGEFSTFTYRDMPFVLAPVIWSRLSSSFHKKAHLKERAHGDGMQVSFDSPEAFEEVIWLTYLKKKIVQTHHLLPVNPDQLDADFMHAMRDTIKKVIYLGQEQITGQQKASRYLSKNNANISRIDAILKLFPEAVILVPYRNPLAHIGSLQRQHERFLKEQSTDTFSRKYMTWLGHYEFGKAFRPINFDNWLQDKKIPCTVNNDFWLEYWSKAYSHILDKLSDKVVLVDFDSLLQNKNAVLTDIATLIGISDIQLLVDQAEKLRLPQSEPVVSFDCTDCILESALDVHERLIEKSTCCR